MRLPCLAAILAVLVLATLGISAHAAECGYRAPNGAVPGTLAAGAAPCKPAAGARAPLGNAAAREKPQGKRQDGGGVYIGTTVGADTRIMSR